LQRKGGDRARWGEITGIKSAGKKKKECSAAGPPGDDEGVGGPGCKKERYQQNKGLCCKSVILQQTKTIHLERKSPPMKAFRTTLIFGRPYHEMPILTKTPSQKRRRLK